jgi:hypothetical protein
MVAAVLAWVHSECWCSGMRATRITRHMNAPRAALVERDL